MYLGCEVLYDVDINCGRAGGRTDRQIIERWYCRIDEDWLLYEDQYIIVKGLNKVHCKQ